MNRKNVIITSIVSLLLILVLFLVFRDSNGKQTPDTNSQTSQEDTYTSDNLTDESTNSDAGDSPDTSTLPAPVLSKSSGNNGPIPAGVLVNFTCSGAVNVDCQIKLASQNGPEEIVLKEQLLVAPDRGQPNVVWTWKAIKGNWNVSAIVSANGYSNNQSNFQELIVQ